MSTSSNLMKVIFSIICILIISSCKQESKTDTLIKKTTETEKTNNRSLVNPINKAEDRLIIHEPSIHQLCPEPFEDAPTQKRIEFGERFLKFCSWDFDSLKWFPLNLTYMMTKIVS